MLTTVFLKQWNPCGLQLYKLEFVLLVQLTELPSLFSMRLKGNTSIRAENQVACVSVNVKPLCLSSPGSQWGFVGPLQSFEVGGSLGSGWCHCTPCPAGFGRARWRHEKVHLPWTEAGEEDCRVAVAELPLQQNHGGHGTALFRCRNVFSIVYKQKSCSTFSNKESCKIMLSFKFQTIKTKIIK